MESSVPLRRSNRLKSVQSNPSTNLRYSDTVELYYSRKRGRPTDLVSKEQVLKSHKVHQDNKLTESLSACSTLNEEKNMPFRCEIERKRTDESNRIMQGKEHVQTSNLGKQNFNAISGPSSPIWSGSICVCHENFGIVDGLTAHTLSKAGVEVFEVAKILPALLHAEMLPRLDVWPASNITSPPTDDIIDLCILPTHKRSEEGFNTLLYQMTEEDLVLKAFLGEVPILIFSSLQLIYQSSRTTSGKHYLWAVFVGKNAFFPHEQKKLNSIRNFDCTVRSTLAKEVHLVPRDQRALSKNGNSEEDRRRNMEKVETREFVLTNNGILLSEAPCTLNGKSIEQQSTGRAVNEGLLKEGICGTTADSIRHEVSSTERTYTERESKDVTGEETYWKRPAISKSLRANVKENITAIGFPETYRLDQLAIKGTGASCSPPVENTVEECARVLEEPGAFSPKRARSESVGPSVLHMASTFDDLTSVDEISSADNRNAQENPYSVQPRYIPVLRAIMDKHGDIARDFPIKCSKMLTFALERVCEAVQDLQAVQFINIQKSHLQSLHSAITDAEFVKLDVKWLRNRYEELVEAVDQIKEFKNLKDSREEMDKIVASQKKVLSLKKTQMLKLQSEIETIESEVAQAAAKSESLSNAISKVTLKFKHFRHNSLVDGLL